MKPLQHSARLLLLSLLLLPSSLLSQGALTPPGAPAATMKTLEQVEPRIDIATVGSSLAGVLHLITESGSYYLSGDIAGGGLSIIIVISASDVTLDLNGFAIVGRSSASGTAILVQTADGVSIRNGSISRIQRAIHFDTVSEGGSVEDLRVTEVVHGIRTSSHALVRQCFLQGASASGIGMETGNDTIVRDCRVQGFDSDGIVTGRSALVVDSIFTGNGNGIDLGPHAVARNCLCEYNGESGITASVGGILIDNCTIARNSGNGLDVSYSSIYWDPVRVKDSQIQFNGGRGVNSTALGIVIERTEVSANGLDGIYLESSGEGTAHRIVGGRVHLNGGEGIYSSAKDAVVESCQVAFNFSYGIRCTGAATIKDCGVSTNSDIGIICTGPAVVTNCIVSENTASGIRCSDSATIEGCTVRANEGLYGIEAGDNSTVKNCRVSDCGADDTNTHGIHAGASSTVAECVVIGTQTAATPSNSNQGVGIYAAQGSKIHACEARGNTGDGIRVGNSSQVLECIALENGGRTDANLSGAGIHVTGYDNVIDGNTVYGNDRGIDVDSIYNLILRNRARTNTTNYDIVANNRVAVIVSAPLSGAVSGSSGGTGLGSTDPWANFSY